jgi:EAL domain-containing protein (putative c-di-GMP-specific phosphodiesterase class I)
VRDISTDAEDRAIVSAIIQMARSLGMRTIAEGVETIEQLSYLHEHHCDEIQGYYFSRPVAASLPPAAARWRRAFKHPV